MSTETKLKWLFDYQRFEKNAELEEMITEAESSPEKALSDDELFFVSAAGEFHMTDGRISENTSGLEPEKSDETN